MAMVMVIAMTMALVMVLAMVLAMALALVMALAMVMVLAESSQRKGAIEWIQIALMYHSFFTSSGEE